VKEWVNINRGTAFLHPKNEREKNTQPQNEKSTKKSNKKKLSLFTVGGQTVRWRGLKSFQFWLSKLHIALFSTVTGHPAYVRTSGLRD
jgi:hypothetical protein